MKHSQPARRPSAGEFTKTQIDLLRKLFKVAYAYFSSVTDDGWDTVTAQLDEAIKILDGELCRHVIRLAATKAGI